MKRKKILQCFWVMICDRKGHNVGYQRLTSSDIANILCSYRICTDDRNHRAWIPKTDLDKSFAYCPFTFTITANSRITSDGHERELTIVNSLLSSYMSNLIYSYYV